MSTTKPEETVEIDHSIDTNTGLIAWFARNSVAANLLMTKGACRKIASKRMIRVQF